MFCFPVIQISYWSFKVTPVICFEMLMCSKRCILASSRRSGARLVAYIQMRFPSRSLYLYSYLPSALSYSPQNNSLPFVSNLFFDIYPPFGMLRFVELCRPILGVTYCTPSYYFFLSSFNAAIYPINRFLRSRSNFRYSINS